MKSHPPILIFDGECVLCSNTVQFVLAHERDNKICFVAMQSDQGQEILNQLGFEAKTLDTFLFIDQFYAYVKSDAALAMLYHLKGAVRLLFVTRYIPRGIRDWAYSLLVKCRFKLFGRRDSCQIGEAQNSNRYQIPEPDFNLLLTRLS